jgi:hypothetical protein
MYVDFSYGAADYGYGHVGVMKVCWVAIAKVRRIMTTAMVTIYIIVH